MDDLLCCRRARRRVEYGTALALTCCCISLRVVSFIGFVNFIVLSVYGFYTFPFPYRFLRRVRACHFVIGFYDYLRIVEVNECVCVCVLCGDDHFDHEQPLLFTYIVRRNYLEAQREWQSEAAVNALAEKYRAICFFSSTTLNRFYLLLLVIVSELVSKHLTPHFYPYRHSSISF